MKKVIFLIASIIFFSNSLYASENDDKYNSVIANTEKIAKDLNYIKSQQKIILESEKDDSINIKKEIFIPTALSLFAGILFWVIFQARPQYFRKRKLRPKIETDLLYINSTMAHLIELAMIDTENPVSRFHDELLNNKFTKELFKIGLMNKALNQSHLVGQFSNNIVIGEKIYDKVKTIDSKIDRIFNFSDQLTEKEILVLEDIHQLINKYGFSDFKRPYISTDKITQMSFVPKDPSLSYLDDFFFNVYKLRLNLIELLLSTRSNNKSVVYIKISHLKHSGNYSKAIKLVKKQIKEANQTDITHLKWILFSLLYRSNRNQSISLLKDIMANNPSIISNRGYFLDLLGDKDVVEIIQSNTSTDEYQRLLNNEAIQQQIKQRFLKANTEKLKLVA